MCIEALRPRVYTRFVPGVRSKSDCVHAECVIRRGSETASKFPWNSGLPEFDSSFTTPDPVCLAITGVDYPMLLVFRMS